MRTFGPLHRFDHHTGAADGSPCEDLESRAIAYLADNWQTTGAEVFGDKRFAAVCERHRLAVLALSKEEPIQLLHGAAAMSLGAYHSIGAGEAQRSVTQAWARAIYEESPSGEVIGIEYATAHDGGLALALWERASALGVVQDRPVYSLWPRFLIEMGARKILAAKVPPENCKSCHEVGLTATYTPPPGW